MSVVHSTNNLKWDTTVKRKSENFIKFFFVISVFIMVVMNTTTHNHIHFVEVLKANAYMMFFEIGYSGKGLINIEFCDYESDRQ